MIRSDPTRLISGPSIIPGVLDPARAYCKWAPARSRHMHGASIVGGGARVLRSPPSLRASGLLEPDGVMGAEPTLGMDSLRLMGMMGPLRLGVDAAEKSNCLPCMPRASWSPPAVSARILPRVARSDLSLRTPATASF